MAEPRYRTVAADLILVEPLDIFTAVFHRPSGITHLLSEPAPQIMEALVPAPLEAPVPVNVNTAGRDVLMGLTGLQQEAAVRTILALRQVQPFESLSVMFMANPELAAALSGSVGTASSFFRVRARAALGHQHCAVMAWVERNPTSGDIRILQWVAEEG